MYRLPLSIAALLAASHLFAEPDIAEEEQVRKQIAVCAGCHGEDGRAKDPQFPNLAGQNKAYLLKQLHKFRSNERHDDVMSPVAMILTDEEMEFLATYYSQRTHAPGECG